MASQRKLLEELNSRIHLFKDQLIALNLDENSLIKSAAPGKWNAQECFEHLVVMWQTYRPQFERGIQNAKKKTNDEYKMAWFGKWFANKMAPLEDNNSGMRTSKIFEPSNYSSELPAVQRLIEVQDEMLKYLKLMEDIDINKSRISSPATKFIRLKMGDAWQIILNHQDRHLQQAVRAATR